MSRIGLKPVPIPSGVKIAVAGKKVNIEGPKGKLSLTLQPQIDAKMDEGGRQLVVSRKSDDRQSKALHGTARALLNNMIQGVHSGYEKQLEIIGVGYVCSLKGKNIALRVGYANEIQRPIPAGLEVICPDQTHITIKGCDRQLVGQFAAELRSLRKPEPYKGKGIRYVGEYVKIKPGKAAG
jgi:large subunit ribosomal protein L6